MSGLAEVEVFQLNLPNLVLKLSFVRCTQIVYS